MSQQNVEYELPNRIEHLLATLSKLYARDEKSQLQQLIVNAKIRVREGWSCDNWNGGTFGHALYLVVPESLFMNAVEQKEDIQKQIGEGLNKMHNIPNEFIAEVFLEMDAPEDNDWRSKSGLLLDGKRVAPPDATRRIWDDDGFRLFLSHKSQFKVETAELKSRLGVYGVSCFVAHEDIHPTKAWQDEIENALASMDGFVALMTEDFHDSEWTDQEVGYAVAQGVPIIAVRLGKDPYGFIGKFQALVSTWSTAPADIVRILINREQVFNGFVQALKACGNYERGNMLAKMLTGIEKLTVTQIDALVEVYNGNDQLRGSHGFNGKMPGTHGPGLVAYLNQFGDRKFGYSHFSIIELSA